MVAFRPRNPHLQKTVWLTVLVASVAMPFVLTSRLAPSFDAPAYLVTVVQGKGAATSQGVLTGALGGVFGLGHELTGTLTVVYLVVVLLLVARFAAGFLHMWRILRGAVPLESVQAGKFDVRVSPKVRSPATFGPTILLPAEAREWSEARLAAVLTHERSHVQCNDCYVQWLARLHACIFWFNPLAWWLHRRLAELAEITSDDAVIEATADRMGYADLLLEIARHPTPGRVAVSMARPNISARIERIISNIPPASQPRRWMRALAVAVLVMPITMAAATLQAPGTPEANGSSGAPPQEKVAPPTPARDPSKPGLLYVPNSAEFYPVEAKRMGKEALVLIEVGMDHAGVVTSVRVLNIEVLNPQSGDSDIDWGFATSAEQLGYQMRFANPVGAPTSIRMRVKFELKKENVIKELLGPGEANSEKPK
jgi:beta-lactamase regulating signal transducer with metallopeptidase domain